MFIIRKHLGSLSVDIDGNKIIVKDWGLLSHLGESPCRRENILVTFYSVEWTSGGSYESFRSESKVDSTALSH